MEVLKDVETVDIQGHKLEVHLGTFIESEKLFSETIKCYKEGKEGVEFLTVDSIKEALIPLLKKSFFDKTPINDFSFFGDVKMRGFYVPVCLKVIEINTSPFMTSPL